jgi:hypothetical protein
MHKIRNIQEFRSRKSNYAFADNTDRISTLILLACQL